MNFHHHSHYLVSTETTTSEYWLSWWLYCDQEVKHKSLKKWSQDWNSYILCQNFHNQNFWKITEVLASHHHFSAALKLLTVLLTTRQTHFPIGFVYNNKERFFRCDSLLNSLLHNRNKVIKLKGKHLTKQARRKIEQCIKWSVVLLLLCFIFFSRLPRENNKTSLLGRRTIGQPFFPDNCSLNENYSSRGFLLRFHRKWIEQWMNVLLICR